MEEGTKDELSFFVWTPPPKLYSTSPCGKISTAHVTLHFNIRGVPLQQELADKAPFQLSSFQIHVYVCSLEYLRCQW